MKRDCNIIMGSHSDPDPSKYNDKEWISSVYTLDGNTIYALIHNEYQGHSHSGQCPSNDYFKCWYNAVTLAKSTDKGLTYSHGPAPAHLVASIPYRYVPDIGPTGIFAPTNIIHNQNDGYYYALAQLVFQQQGSCVMRTQTLDTPASWRAWNGKSFSVQFINPYTAQNFNPADHVCQLVPAGGNNLTFNTYFNKFLLIQTGRIYDPVQDKFIRGFYYSLSDDLIHWSPRQLIMEGQDCATRTTAIDCLSYPSLIDPKDTSRNFEITGQKGYIYYTRWHGGTSLDRDLVRIPIEFTKFEGQKLVWDFTQGSQGWWSRNTQDLRVTKEGLEFDSIGRDPYIVSPQVEYPKGENLRITIRMKSTADANGQFFYGQSLPFSEKASTRFTINPDGEWHEYVLVIPPQEGGIFFRLDPASAPGHIAVAWISVAIVDRM